MVKNIPWIFIAVIIICLLGFRIDVMDVDAAQYASMSKEMLEHKNFLFLYDGGNDYLDKPPFLFWITSLSMKIFGANNFAYRLPSFLFSLLALYSTFRLALIYYTREIANLAALVLATCQGFFLMNHDVRTDTILMGCVIFSLWQLARWFNDHKFRHFLLGCTGIAFGMMSKGPVALLVPVFAFGSNIVLQRNFKALLKWEYLIGVIIIGILLLPMCIGLYRQFDLHPEKHVNYQTGVSGLRFFFWTQSFGRITGESSWNNHSNISTPLQSMLWSYLPWILFFLTGLFLDVKKIIRQKFLLFKGEEAVTTGGFILTYISLGLSKYQLPHYIFVVFPLASIITAKFIHRLITEDRFSRVYKFLLNFHFIIFTLLWIILQLLLYTCFETIPLGVGILSSVFFGIFLIWFLFKKKSVSPLPALCIFTFLGINLFLNLSFYPALLRYQMGNTAGRWLAEQKLPKDKIFLYPYSEFHSLSFYAAADIHHKDSIDQIRGGDWIVTGEEHLPDLDKSGIKYDVIYRNKSYRVSRLSLQFLNPHTRPKQLSAYDVIKIK